MRLNVAVLVATLFGDDEGREVAPALGRRRAATQEGLMRIDASARSRLLCITTYITT